MVGKLIGDLAAFTSLHATAEDGDGLSRGLKPVGNGVEMFDPGGKHQDVGSGSGGGQHVADDLVESYLIGDEGSIDFGHSTGRGGVGVTAVLEFGRVQVQNWVGRQ